MHTASSLVFAFALTLVPPAAGAEQPCPDPPPNAPGEAICASDLLQVELPDEEVDPGGLGTVLPSLPPPLDEAHAESIRGHWMAAIGGAALLWLLAGWMLARRGPGPGGLGATALALVGSIAVTLPALGLLSGLVLFNVVDPPTTLRSTPREEPATTVRGEGTVHRGRSTPRGEGSDNRDYAWIWFEPAADAPCREYRWYQFVKPGFYMVEADGTRRGPQRRLPEMEAATGLKFKYNRWNPDYHKDAAKAEDKQRKRDGQSKLPKWKPDGLRSGVIRPKKGKPYVRYNVPGTNPGGTTRLTGILDAPNFCERPSNTKMSPIEVLYALKNHVNRRQPRSPHRGDQPPSATRRAEVVTEVRDYLVCVDGGTARCIGYVPWSYTQRATIATSWTRAGGGNVPTAGLDTTATWTYGSRITRCEHTLRFGEWVNGC